MKRSIFVVLVIVLLGLLASGVSAKTDPKGQVSMTQNWEDANGVDGFGDINRNGVDFVSDGGSHGPMGPGPDEISSLSSSFTTDDGIILDLQKLNELCFILSMAFYR